MGGVLEECLNESTGTAPSKWEVYFLLASKADGAGVVAGCLVGRFKVIGYASGYLSSGENPNQLPRM